MAGKVVLVTGGGAGLGRSIAQGFSELGALVVIAGRRFQVLEETAAELPGTVVPIAADVANEDSVLQLFETIVNDYQRLDVLVNNAGFGIEANVDELTLRDWQSVIDTNLTGAFLCAREAFRQMKKQGGGRIINIGSISAHSPRAQGSAYAATKWALDGLTRAWSLEGREHGIATSILHPGGVATSFQGGPELTEKLGFFYDGSR